MQVDCHSHRSCSCDMQIDHPRSTAFLQHAGRLSQNCRVPATCSVSPCFASSCLAHKSLVHLVQCKLGSMRVLCNGLSLTALMAMSVVPDSLTCCACWSKDTICLVLLSRITFAHRCLYGCNTSHGINGMAYPMFPNRCFISTSTQLCNYC